MKLSFANRFAALALAVILVLPIGLGLLVQAAQIVA